MRTRLRSVCRGTSTCAGGCTRARTVIWYADVPGGERRPVVVLTRACVANLDNITALPKATLVERAGRLRRDELTALCSAARFAIGC